MKRREYQDFLAGKRIETRFAGIEPKEPHPKLFQFQRDIVKWALRRGRACIWADCGLGKSFMQIEWARQIQLDVIERAMELWSNPGDTVLSPFAGIGSEGFVAITTGRKFIGMELKASYWKQAASNLALAEAESAHDLFAKTA